LSRHLTRVCCASRWFLAGAALLAAACSSASRRPEPGRTPLRPPILASSYILAPALGDADLELEDLHGVTGHPAMLRRAWIHLERKRPQQAIDAAAEVLYAVERPSPAEEAYARYIRAESYAAMGQVDRGVFDRARAAELALDPELRRRLESRTADRGARSESVGLALQRRSNWSPAPLIAARLDPMGRVWRLTVHHSAMYFRDSSPQSASVQIQQIQRQHMVGRGYGDIGYHYLIDPAGRIWEGRDVRWQGAHARGENNQGNIGVCVLGNFVRGSGGQFPTESQTAALRTLMTQLMQKHSIPPEQIKSHRDFVVTECPGALLQAIVDRFVRDAAERNGHKVAAQD
jgi:hypothetical protein